MADERLRRLRWERVPLLGNNPVFCFEARRLWRRRTIAVLVLLLVVLALVSRVVHPVLDNVRPRSGAAREWRSVWSVLWSAAPPPTEGMEDLLSLRGTYGRRRLGSHLPFLILTVLQWVTHAAAIYLIAPIVALSLTGDRAAGRLAPLLVSRTSPRQVLLGKLMAPVLPLCVLFLASQAVCGPLAMPGYAADWVTISVLFLPTMLWVFIAGVIGLCVGTFARHPATAIAVSVIGSTLAYQLVGWGVGTVVWLLLGLPEWTSGGAPGWFQFGAMLLVNGIICGGMWLLAERQLTRAAE